MKKRNGFLFTTAAAALLLAACGNDLAASTDSSKESESKATSAESSSTVVESVELNKSDTLDFAHAQNNKLTLTYNQATPITLPNGKTISQGDLKPVWQYIGEEIGVKFTDKALQDATSTEFIDLQATTGFTESDVYSGSMASDFVRYGQEGYFVNLKERLNDMPNLKKFFEENPTIEASVTAPDGGIYYVPYVQELGYHAMTFFNRPDWVTSLLDAEDALEAETTTIPVAYEGFVEGRHAKNVVKLQNEAAQGGTLERDAALTTLKNYIKETYPKLEKPSDLYLGENAQYDMDELVALWRVIKASPNTLSKVTTGQVVDGAVTTPFFVRSSGATHTNYLMRFANYFNGQIIYGVDGSSHFYLNNDGELTWSLTEPGALEAFENLRGLWQEGLFYEEMANTNNSDNFRNILYGRDEDPNNKQFGFMTLDWIASTSAASKKVEAVLPPVTKIGKEKDFVHFIGGSRPLMTFGSAVSTASSEEEINSALTLFDYMFSEDGAKVFNFGTPDMWAEGEVFTGPDGAEYPKLDEWIVDQASQYSKGDMLMFMKEFLGANLQTSYPKSIGVELQGTPENGLRAWDLYQNNEVLQPSYDATENFLKITPVVWPINEQQQARLDTTNIGNEQRDMVKLYIMNSTAGPTSTEEIEQLYKDGNLDTYVQVYRDIFKGMQK